MELSKKAQQALEQNNQYLKNLGDTLGYQIESKPVSSNGIKSWEISIKDQNPDKDSFRKTITYRNASDNHTRPIDDKLMSLCVNDPKKQATLSPFEKKFQESFNKYENAVNLANKLQNELTEKQEQKISKKMKI